MRILKISDYFGNYSVNNYNLLKKYMNKFNKKLSKYYNFGYPFFKGKYKRKLYDDKDLFGCKF